VIAVRDHLDQLGDTLPVVIMFADDPSRLAAYRTYLDLEFPVVADVDRTLYRLLGAGLGSFFSGVVTGDDRDVRPARAPGPPTPCTDGGHPPTRRRRRH